MPTTGYVKLLDDVLQALEDADLKGTLDPGKLRLPGVFIRLDALTHPRLVGGVASYTGAVVSVFACVQTQDPTRTLAALQPHLEAVAAVIPTGPADVRHVSLALPAGGTPAAAMQYTTNLRIGD